MNLGSRHGPSGPRIELQLPFYGASFPSADEGTYYAQVGGSILVPDGALVEESTGYLVPQRGRLGTFLVRNSVSGDDAVNVYYQLRRNGSAIGSPLVLGNNAVGPVQTDLSKYGVNVGNLLTIQAILPAGMVGALPVPKFVLTWFPGAAE